MALDENKQKAIELAIKQIDKAFGKGALIRLGDKPVEKIDAISTGSLGLDIALGIGGVPKGRIVEVYGPESSGKRLWRYKSLQNVKRRVESVRLLTQNTH